MKTRFTASIDAYVLQDAKALCVNNGVSFNAWLEDLVAQAVVQPQAVSRGPVTLREVLDTLGGAFSDGYTADDATDTLRALSTVAEVSLAIGWHGHDDDGYHGDSDLYVLHNAKAYDAPDQLMMFLMDGCFTDDDVELTATCIERYRMSCARPLSSKITAITAHNFAFT